MGTRGWARVATRGHTPRRQRRVLTTSLVTLLVATAVPGVATSAETPTEEETSAATEPTPAETPLEAASEPTPDPTTEAVAPLSENPPGTAMNSMVFYAYVEADESLDVLFSRAGGSGAATVTVDGPAVAQTTCTIPSTGTPPCDVSGLSSAETGVWRIELAADTIQDHFTWQIDVVDGASTLDGRVWSELYTMRQASSATPATLTFWYQNEHGFLYEATYGGFNGIHSTFRSDSVGVRYDGTCDSAYQSAGAGGPAGLSQAGLGECGDPYKIFFEQPDADLPATATRWDGNLDWIAPPIAEPEITNVDFVPDSTSVRSGTVTFDVTNFSGPLTVQVDTDNDGVFDGPADRALTGFADAGAGSASFDGVDGQGDPVPATRDIGVRVLIDRVGEIHFVNSDVELRSGGLEVVALNGPAAGSDLLYWDDTQLSTTGRCSLTPQPDGTPGVASTGGTHSWGPGTCGLGGVGNEPWGNNRAIDDWTYQPMDVAATLVVDGYVQPAWGCTPDGLLFQYPDGTPTEIYLIDLVTGDPVDGPEIEDRSINAVAYNVVDDYIYGWDNAALPGGAGERVGIVRVGADGSAVVYGVPDHSDLNPAATFPVGDIDGNGHYWVSNSTGAGASATWYQIDLNPGPTFREVLDSGAVGGGDAAGFAGSGDWAWVPGGGDNLYRVMREGNTGEWSLFRFDRGTGDHHNVGRLPALDAYGNTTFGAAFADEEFLYVSDNGTGDIMRVDVQAVSATKFTDGPESGANDGARCAIAPIDLDYGDAPIGYETLLIDDGPRHGLRDYNAGAGTTSLMLGGTVDDETDGQPTAAADGDGDDGVADSITLLAGDPTTVTVNVTNATDEGATLAGWIDLDGDGAFEPTELVTQSIDPATTGDVDLVFPAGTTTTNTYARFRLFPGTVATPQPTGPASAGEVEDYLVLAGRVHYEKTVDPADVAALTPGETFTYAVTVSNLGNVALSGLSFTDDLSDVTGDGDALYNGDVAVVGPGTAQFDADQISWSGDLASGQTAVVTYSVEIADPPDGDAILANAVIGTGPGSNCTESPPNDPDCFKVVPQPQVSVTKTSDAAGTVDAGGTVEYEFTVTNTGPAAADNVVVIDDLSGVLDDASYDGNGGATSGNLSFDPGDQELVWNGPLAAAGEVGDSVTVTYSVSVNGADALGDGTLQNALLSSGCPNPPIFDPQAQDFDPDCVEIIDIAAWTAVKTSAAPGIVRPDDVVEYSVVVTNTGQVDLTGLSFTDELSGVIDDAGYEGDVDADVGLAVFVSPDQIQWAGDLTVGSQATITYSVRVRGARQLGDGILTNAITGPPNCPAAAVTDPQHPDYNPDCVPVPPLVEAWDVVKTSDASVPVLPGDVVEYELTITNLGAVDLTDLEVADDLSDVVDDAEFNGGSASRGTVSYAAPALGWTGDLLVGQQAFVTYSVTVAGADELGNGQLVNAVTGSPNCPAPAVTDPQAAGFDPDCVTISDIQAWTAVKTSNADTNPGADDVVIYRLTVSNTGNVALAAADVLVEDDLTEVLDDAVYNGDADQGALYSEPVLSWSGDLAVDEVVVITYSVTVNAADSLGDGVLVNVLTGPPNCPDPAVTDPEAGGFNPDCVSIEHIAAYTVVKSADAPAPAVPGDTILYSVTVRNTGGADLLGAAAAEFADDLSGVLDDASYADDAAADIGSVSYAEPTISWVGELPVGAVATVTYSVSVDAPIGGDHLLTNAVVGGDCPDPAVTDEGHPDFDPDCVNVIRLPGVHLTKTVFGDAVTDLEPGDGFEYVVTVENIGQMDLVGESFTDDLSDVVDDATLDPDSLSADVGSVAFDAPAEIVWTGDLAVGETATVRYAITIDDPIAGDGALLNAVVGPEYSNCLPDGDDPDCWEDTPVANVIVHKESLGSQPEPGDVVTYRITAENRGGATATGETIVDDLTGVLDTAVYNGDAAASSGTVAYAEPMLTWQTDILAGETVELVYTVTVRGVDDLGDGRLVNTVVGGDNCGIGHEQARDTGRTRQSHDTCGTEDAVAAVTFDKSIVSPVAGLVEPGDEVTYRITVANVGGTVLDGASFTDDLSQVLLHGLWSGHLEADRGTVSYDAPILTWAGELEPGQTASVTYRVLLAPNAPPDAAMRNVVVGQGPGSNCPPDSDDSACAADFEVSAASPPLPAPGLPVTGARLLLLAAIGAATLLLGGLLLSATPQPSRRRYLGGVRH